MSTRLFALSLALLLASFLPTTTHASAIVDPVVDGNTLAANIDLGLVEAELSIEFEQVVGLSVDNLGLSAELINPIDPALLSRLEDPLANSLPGTFPVLVRIQPPANGGLSFSGVVTIQLYTHNLQYAAATPLRLFSAPDGGEFRDITESISSGSYRVRGGKGTFSEFLIVADLRATSVVVDDKFSVLSALLYNYSSQIDSTVFATLQTQLGAAESAWDNGDAVEAIANVEAFSTTVSNASGNDIPDVWRSARDIDNVAGELRATAKTLRFSLTRASNGL